jgi:hypothetical protein
VTFLRRFFGDKPESEAVKKTRAILAESQGISELSTPILTSAARVGEFLKPHFPGPDKATQWFFAQAEVLFVFLHLVNRVALQKLGTERRALLADQLAPFVFRVFVQTLFSDGSAHEDEIGNLMIGVQEREQEYAACKRLFAEDGERVFDLTNIMSLATQKTLESAGYEPLPGKGISNPIRFLELHLLLLDLYKESKLSEKVIAAGNVLRITAGK